LERNIISRRISQILDEISRLSNALYALDNTDIEKYPDNYEMLSTDAALRSELITCRLRHLIYASTNVKKPEYLTSAGVVQGINIHNENGILEITLPCLLPKRRQQQNTEFLIDPVYFRLSQYADSHAIPKFQHCVVCFSHIYSQELSQRRVRDYDNLELKQLLDVISAFIMQDDTGLLCDSYNTSEIGEYDCTRISVMNKDQFSGWLSERENRLKSISDF